MNARLLPLLGLLLLPGCWQAAEKVSDLTATAVSQKAECELPVLNPVEPVVLMGKIQIRILARVDTGADFSSLDSALAREIGVDEQAGREILIYNAHGVTRRKVVSLRYILRGQVRSADFTLIERSNMDHPALLGLSALDGFLVNPAGACAGC